MKKIVILFVILLNCIIIILGIYQEMNIKIILLCLFIGNILIVSIYLFYRIKDIGGKL